MQANTVPFKPLVSYSEKTASQKSFALAFHKFKNTPPEAPKKKKEKSPLFRR
jgi:hypothetical protein